MTTSEERLSRLEGVYEHLASKADVAEVKAEVTEVKAEGGCGRIEDGRDRMADVIEGGRGPS